MTSHIKTPLHTTADTAEGPCRPALLLVEDDIGEVARLEPALTRLGYACTHAGDGDTALEMLKTASFDVVLLDLVLPGLDGMGLLSAMATLGLHVPVVVAVTPAGMECAASAMRAGARDFVVKPAGALRLQVALANAIALGHAGKAPAIRPPQTGQDAGTSAIPTQHLYEKHSHADHLHAQLLRMQQWAMPRTRDENAATTCTRPGFPTLPWAEPARPEAAVSQTGTDGHIRPLELIEADAIRFACDLYGGRLAEVARRLGIGRSTLYRKLARIAPELAFDTAPPAAPAHTPLPQQSDNAAHPRDACTSRADAESFAPHFVAAE